MHLTETMNGTTLCLISLFFINNSIELNIGWIVFVPIERQMLTVLIACEMMVARTLREDFSGSVPFI